MNSNITTFKKPWIWLLLTLSFLLNPASTQATENWTKNFTAPTKIKLQLKWQHQFQFAGYYMAQAKGFYQQQGLDIEFIEATPHLNPIKEVLDGHAQFGVGTSELLLNYHQGDALVVLGVIFQHSPLGLVTLESSHIDVITDLIGHKVMIEENSSEIYALLQQSNIRADQLISLQHHFNIDELISGDVDAMTVYTTSEPFELSKNNIPYRIFTPRMAGIDFYGDNFFTTQSYLKQNPELVEAFRSATIQGWKYAMTHIDETVQFINQTYPSNKSVEALTYEAKAMHSLMRTDLIEPGHMSDKRWQHIASVYKELGLLNSERPLTDFLYNKQAVLENLQIKIHDLILVISASAALILVILFVLRRIHRIKTQLTTMINHSPLAILLLDKNLNVIEWNHQADHIFGWKAKEVIGKNALDFLVLDAHRSKVHITLKNVLEQQKTIHLENQNYHKDGHELTCNWSNAPFTINGQHFVICMATDNTEFRDLKALSFKQSDITSSASNSQSQEAFLDQLVSIMVLSLLIWEESTSKSKIEFAEQSKLWRISIDGGTAKTRTLDKYLSLDNIPKKPRWKNVINTANFILRTFPTHPRAFELETLKKQCSILGFK